MPTGIYDDYGNLTGVEDETADTGQGQSRLPTDIEKITNTPIAENPRFLNGGGGSSRGTRITNPVTPTTTSDSLTKQITNVREITSIQDTAPLAVNINGNVYTSKGEVYPVTIIPNTPEKEKQYEEWIPKGYQKGSALYNENSSFVITPEGSQGVSTKYGEGYRTSKGELVLTKPDEEAIKAEKQSYYNWATTQKSIKPTTFVDTLKEQEKYYKSIGYKSPSKFELLTNEISEVPSTIGKFTEQNIGYIAPKYVSKPLGFIAGTGIFLGAAPFWLGAYGANIGTRYMSATTTEQKQSALVEAGMLIGLIALPKVFGVGKSTARTIRAEKSFYKVIQDKQGNIFKIYDTQKKPVNTAFDIIKPVIKDEAQYSKGIFWVKTIVPEQYAIETPKSKIRQFFFSPKQVTTSSERVFKGKSTFIYTNEAGEIVGNPYVATGREGAKLKFISSIEGKQVTYTPEEFSKLPEPIQSQIQRNIEKRIGVPVSRQTAPFQMKLEDTYSFGEVVNTKVLRLSPSNKLNPAKPIPFGRRTTIGSISTKATPTYENALLTEYKTTTYVEDISKPRKYFEKPPKVEDTVIIGKSLVFKEPLDYTTSSGKTILKVKKTTSEGALRNILTKSEAITAKSFSNVKPKIPKPKENVITQETSKAITSATLPKSDYYGTGQYELTSENGLSPKILQQRTVNTEIQVVEPKFKTIQLSNTELKIIQKEDINLKHNQKFFEKQTTEQKENLKEALKENVIQKELLKEKLAQKQVLKSKLIEKQVVKPRVLQKLQLNYKLPKVKTNELFASSQSKLKQAYDVLIFNRGKEERIASGLPENKAKQLGVRSVLSNLRASFKLSPHGTTMQEDISFNLPSSFRLGKYDKMRFVQKKETRFGQRGETKEAQFFRKVKKGKVKWF